LEPGAEEKEGRGLRDLCGIVRRGPILDEHTGIKNLITRVEDNLFDVMGTHGQARELIQEDGGKPIVLDIEEGPSISRVVIVISWCW
jgi:hypothetical protein